MPLITHIPDTTIFEEEEKRLPPNTYISITGRGQPFFAHSQSEYIENEQAETGGSGRSEVNPHITTCLASNRCTSKHRRGELQRQTPYQQSTTASMSVKHDLTEPDKSSRPQKRMTPASSSDSPSSPGFSATATSPALSRPFFPLPSFDPALFNTPDVDISNYTTLATATSSETREDMDHMEEIQKMALPHESVEDYITSVTPVRSTADSAIDNDIDFLDNSPRSIGSPTSPTASDGALELTKEPRSISEGTRQDMYRQSFQGKEVELHKMRLPDMCAMLPDHADEVIQAYLTHTRFTANIWANYDSVDKELYLWEDQIKSCGKLVLFPTQLKMLEKLDPKVYQFMKVRLNIGTPFRTLFVLYIDSVPEKTNNPDSEWRLAGRVEFCDDPRGPHYILENVLRIAYRNIEEDGVAKGQHGLTFNDLQAIAAEFLYKPKDLGESRQFYSRF